MNKWLAEMHKFDENKTYKETAGGNDMASLKLYLNSLGNPEVYYSVAHSQYCVFNFKENDLTVSDTTEFSIKTFKNEEFHWSILDNKELYIALKSNLTAGAFTFIPLAPVLFSHKGGEQ
jgi:hypothetical protein